MKNANWVLITLMLGTSMAAIDSSIVNVSLPVIRNQFNVDIDQVEWVVTAYMVSFCLFIPLINWLKRRVGYYNLFLISVAVFTAGSLLCSLSTNLTMLFSVRYLRFLKTQPGERTRFDIAGYSFFALFIISVQYTISLISKHQFIPWKMLSGIAVISGSLYLFIRSSRKDQPLLDLTVFRSTDFINATIIIVIRSVALFGGMFFLPFLLQGLLGYTAIQSGLLMLPNALMMLVSRPYAGKKADQGLIRNISLIGIFLVAISMFLFSRINVGYSIALIILPMMIRGLGMSLLVAPVSTTMLNSVSQAQTATATSMNSLLQQLGGSIGIASFGVAHDFIYQHYLDKKYSTPLAEHFALQDGFLLAGFVIALALLPAWKLPEKKIILSSNPSAKS